MNYPRGSIYTTILELGPKNHYGDGLLGPNSRIVVYMDPLGTTTGTSQAWRMASRTDEWHVRPFTAESGDADFHRRSCMGGGSHGGRADGL